MALQQPIVSLKYELNLAQGLGWVQGAVNDGMAAGTIQRALPAHAVRITGLPPEIEYRAHVSDEGWLPWGANGAIAGTEGGPNRLEAIQFRLVGNSDCGIVGRAHVGDIGWQLLSIPFADPVAPDEHGFLGTVHVARSIEAIQLWLVMPINYAADHYTETQAQREMVLNTVAVLNTPAPVEALTAAATSPACLATLGHRSNTCIETVLIRTNNGSLAISTSNTNVGPQF